MVSKKEVQIVCEFCKKEIFISKEPYVKLSTYNMRGMDDEHDYFHLQCWSEYFNSKVLEKAKVQLKIMQDRAMSILKTPMISSLLSNIQGTEQLFEVAETPISVRFEVDNPKKDKKIKDGKGIRKK